MGDVRDQNNLLAQVVFQTQVSLTALHNIYVLLLNKSWVDFHRRVGKEPNSANLSKTKCAWRLAHAAMT